jgi:diguanylate cyclase (GGDEF)-like protein
VSPAASSLRRAAQKLHVDGGSREARASMRGLFPLLLLVLSLSTISAAELQGRPPLQQLVPELGVFPQNFGLIELAEGGLAVASQEGVLLFDGERWSLLRLPNREIVRSLARGVDGTIWVGGYNSFGRLLRESNGRYRFEELSEGFFAPGEARGFADIWSMLVVAEGVYFRSLREVFFLSADGTQRLRWRHEGRFGAIAELQGQVLLQFRGEGFRVRAGDDWQALPHTTALTELVHTLLPLDAESLLAWGSDGHWWQLGRDSLQRVSMPAGLPPASQFQKAARLRDGHLALASGAGALFLVDPLRESFVRLRLEQGFLSGVWQAADDSLLVSGNSRIHRLVWPPEWTALDDTLGLQGSLQRVREYGGELLTFSGGGAARAVAIANGPSELRPFEVSEQGVFDRLPLPDGSVLYAGSHHLLQLRDGRLTRFSEELVYPRSFHASTFHAGLHWLATEHGLRTLDLRGPEPRLGDVLHPADNMRVRSVAETADALWLGSERSGIWRYRLDAGQMVVEAERMGTPQGIEYGPIAFGHVSLGSGGAVHASTTEGLWRWSPDGRFVEDDFHGLAAVRQAEERLRLLPSEDGGHWAFSPTRMLRRGEHGWQVEPLGGLCRGAIEQIETLSDGRRVIACAGSVLLQSGTQPSVATAPAVRLTSAQRSLDGAPPAALELGAGMQTAVPARGFAIAFEFALPDLDRSRAAEYRWRLRGMREDWTPWLRSTRVNYSQLAAGDYRFELQARDAQGRISSATPWSFHLLPPWHELAWVRVGFGLLLLALAVLWTRLQIRRRTARLDAERRRLAELVDARTAELAEANRRLEDIANRDGLTGLANRRRQDAYLRAVWFQCQERQRPLSVLIVDVDHFKQYNDRHGHPAGDALLQSLAELLTGALRRSEDLVTRYGGEEFLVVLPSAPLERAAEFARDLCRAVRESGLGVTVSIGVASVVPTDGLHLSGLIERADRALYAAKSAGRDRVVETRDDGAIA